MKMSCYVCALVIILAANGVSQAVPVAIETDVPVLRNGLSTA